MQVEKAELENYLKSVVGPSARITQLRILGKPEDGEIKEGGYGTPLLIDYTLNGTPQRAVLHTVRAGPFGHEHMADRAQMLLWDHASFGQLPRHIRSIDAGAFLHHGPPVSLGNAEEFFILTEYAEGHGYYEDMNKLRDGSSLQDLDVSRADALADYLLEIHRVKGNEPGLYVRRIRELIGHSECIMGLVDSYPTKPDVVDPACLKTIEQSCVAWRWKLKDRAHRLRQVHGDFHPWNILFRDDADFTLLDRSRGEWGEPADDVTCLTMNYIFFSLQRYGRLDGDFDILFRRFWDRYLTGSGDTEILQVSAPFFAFRGLVMANPLWYPTLDANVRRRLFNFMESVLTERTFKPEDVNRYCGA